MKFYTMFLALASCGYPVAGHTGRPGASCTVTKQDHVQATTCPDGTTETVSDGQQGSAGAGGSTGAAGHDGVSGHDGVAGKDGLYGPTGPAGVDGAQGVQGAVGDTGAVGATGAQGFPGHDGSVITPVVPCPADTSGYPEVLLCIDSVLYAVYDDSGTDVHYAVIPPGSYRTTDGRQCTFAVTAGCGIK